MSSVSEESSASLGPGLRIGILFLSLNFSLDTIKLCRFFIMRCSYLDMS